MTDGIEERLRVRIEGLSAGQREALAQALELPPSPVRAELVAYVTASGTPPTADHLEALARDRLPEYMVPSRYVFVPSLPRAASGKLDRRKLTTLPPVEPVLDAGTDAGSGEMSPPRTDAEHLLADIWKSVLDTDQVDIHDDFFELGGDSILSIRVISRANQAGLAITPERFFASPTIADLAASVEDPTES